MNAWMNLFIVPSTYAETIMAQFTREDAQFAQCPRVPRLKHLW
jgi:hypothetical protein